MEAFITSTFVVALAEIGDKTQLLAIILATRFRRPVPIVLGIFAAKDTFVSPSVVADLDRELTRLGKRHEFHTYGAQHAFFNDARPEVHDAEAAADAWAKTIDFFKRELA